MKGLSIDKVADCVKHDYLGTWTVKGFDYDSKISFRI